MKNKDIGTAVIDSVTYPDTGHFVVAESGQKGTVKHAVEGQQVTFRVYKNKNGRLHAHLLGVAEPSPIETLDAPCPHFGRCGSCLYQRVPYNKQLEIKARQLVELLSPVLEDDSVFDGITGSPGEYGYRNKMDLSFGDEEKGGPLNIGMHRMRTSFSVLDAAVCRLPHNDLALIQSAVRDHARRAGLPFYNKLTHVGYLRYLMLRRSETTGEILVAIAASTQMSYDYSGLVNELLALPLEGSIAGIFLVDDDRYGDALLPDRVTCLYGRDYFHEELLGLTFKVSLFSFFQTNTRGAELLYARVRDYVSMGDACGHVPEEPSDTGSGSGNADGGTGKAPVIYDLYCGTGTIAQILGDLASHVYGIELVDEAVRAAVENASANKLENCTFLSGDVGELIAEIPERPDYVVLDPPREGLMPKALEQIAAFDIPNMVYVSCKPSSFVRDMQFLKEYGWRVSRFAAVDLFPQTPHVETVVLMSRADR